MGPARSARRLGGMPPIVTVLITISAVVAASLVAWFLFTTTSSAIRQPLLEVTGAYALCSGTTCSAVHINVRNVGPVDVTIDGASLEVSGVSASWTCSYSSQLPQGASGSVKCTPSGSGSNIPDGASAVLTLTVTPTGGSQQSVPLAFKIARP